MVAPFGPVRAEALRLTLVRPEPLPCTTTCVSTVSPRAPDKLIVEVVSGTSVFPTRTKLETTHIGNGVFEFQCIFIMNRMEITISTFARKSVPPTMRNVPRMFLLARYSFDLGTKPPRPPANGWWEGAAIFGSKIAEYSR